MRCPACGVYHPPLYEQCVSCGAKLGTANVQVEANAKPEPARKITASELDNEPGHHGQRKSKVGKQSHKAGIPFLFGILFAVIILLVSAGATIFFLTKPPDYERLYQQGVHEVANGQYAFATRTLEQAASLRPQDARIYLALARAYVGVDQIDKAWQCVSQAAQLGHTVASEPALASDLANYYRQHQKWDRAAELLRPLAQSGIAGKKAELADLDGLWGDECIRTGDLNSALKCWEEVRQIGEGTRVTEVDARLATIYQRLANNLLANQDDSKALDYLTKLNVLAPTAANYEKVAEIYERQGKLELAIDQLRQAARLQVKDPLMDRKLANLLGKRGKELLDGGDSSTGLAYLQEARKYDNRVVVPTTALKNVHVVIMPATGNPNISCDVWNPGPEPILSLAIKVEIYDTVANRSVWEKEQKIVDEFVPPIAAGESKPFSLVAPVSVKDNGLTELRIYLSGSLYKAYPLGEKTANADKQSGDKNVGGQRASETKNASAGAVPSKAAPGESSRPPAASAQTGADRATSAPPALAPAKVPAEGQPTSEDKTLKDLEF